jgi:hypothetical protein
MSPCGGQKLGGCGIVSIERILHIFAPFADRKLVSGDPKNIVGSFASRAEAVFSHEGISQCGYVSRSPQPVWSCDARVMGALQISPQAV